MAFDKLDVTVEADRFHHHISLEDNNRTILSGIFGIGKSYFINQFFEIKKNNYIAINLNPVNYSVSQNEDIFELIKFDIAFQLFSQNLPFEKMEFDRELISEFYLMSNYKKTIRLLVENLSKLEHNLDAIVSSTLSLADKIEEEKEKFDIDEKAELLNFVETFYEKKGSIKEENNITILINHLVLLLKEENKQKQIVLVIDDLDRIDPDHIFRILNVFSAHFDSHGEQNKFDFDKVVLICDVDNIRGIFHNKYGTDIDFNGYIDKFYSTEIFYYHFRDVIVDSLDKFFLDIKTTNKELKRQLEDRSTGYANHELSFILKYFILSNGINMRMLINFLKSEFDPGSYVIQMGTISHSRIHNSYTPIFLIMDILIKICGGRHGLEMALKKTIERFPVTEINSSNYWWQERIGNVLMVSEYKRNGFKSDTKVPERYVNPELDLQISYSISRYSANYSIVGRAEEIGTMDDELEWTMGITDHEKKLRKEQVPYFQLLNQAFQSYFSLNKIKT
jgi:hypothetical protein